MKYLREIFDSHYPYKKIPEPEKFGKIRIHRYNFETPKNSYTVGITHFRNFTKVAFHDKKFNFGITNSEGKHAHKVFGTVKHIIKHHLSQYPEIKTITFSGSKESINGGKGLKGTDNSKRTSIYDKALKHYDIDTSDEPEYRGYRVHVK